MISELVEWYNLIFTLPFSLALMYVLIMASGALHFEHEIGVDTDVDHDISLDGHDLAHDTGYGFSDILSLLGLGKIPLSLIIISFSFIWGFSGVVMNKILSGIINYPQVFIIPSSIGAFVASFIGTRYLAIGLSKVMPTTETYSAKPDDFIGKTAKVRFKITDRFGTVTLLDQFNNFHELSCRVKPGEKEISSGDMVVLVGRDEQKNIFYVRHDPLTQTAVEQ